MVTCRFCGEVKPFSWLGGQHCSPWRVSQGFPALRAEDWPSSQAALLRQQRLIEEATGAGANV